MRGLRFLLGAGAAAAACSAPFSDLATMSSEQALEHCKAAFDDFVWRHDIDGTIRVTVRRPSMLAAEKVDCMDRWASRATRPHIFDAGTRPLGRADVLEKAAICGLVPERDLSWTGRDRAVLHGRGASESAIKCLWDWARFVDAPVDLPRSKS